GRPETVTAFVWRRLSDDEVGAAYLDAVEFQGIPVPSSGYMGALYADRAGVLNAVLFKYPERTRAFWDTLGDVTSFRYDAAREEWCQVTRPLPPRGSYTI